MASFEYRVQDPVGLHARTAGKFVKKAQELGGDIAVSFKGAQADAKGLFAVLRLGVKGGDTILVTVQGENAEETARLFQQYCQQAGI